MWMRKFVNLMLIYFFKNFLRLLNVLFCYNFIGKDEVFHGLLLNIIPHRTSDIGKTAAYKSFSSDQFLLLFLGEVVFS